ncbi:MAG: hypothetical protein RRB22_01095 [Gammaproteobacteria bacterium]|nr:hypothetical protein [Gammaproteobacteria bacterium]
MSIKFNVAGGVDRQHCVGIGDGRPQVGLAVLEHVLPRQALHVRAVEIPQAALERLIGDDLRFGLNIAVPHHTLTAHPHPHHLVAQAAAGRKLGADQVGDLAISINQAEIDRPDTAPAFDRRQFL